MKVFILLILIVFIAIGCKSVPEVKNPESEADVSYKRGLAYLEQEDFEEAEQEFMKVITDYSFSKFEPFARIGLGDTYYAKEEYAAAIEVYKLFIKMRPNHEKADYATYQLGNCYFAQKPTDFFILPDPDEKDLKTVYDAAVQYQNYLHSYPKGAYLLSAEKQLGEAEAMLISREMKVANFYLKKDKCPAVMMRIKYIKTNFKTLSPEVNREISEMEKTCSAKK